MAYIDSGSIDVFPSTRRTHNLSESRQVTEAHLASIVNKLIDKDGFVITTDVSNTGAPFSFNIHGYFFDTTIDAITTALGFTEQTAACDIYGVIEIDTQTDEASPVSVPKAFYELKGADDNNEYHGLVVTTEAPTSSTNQYALHLLNYAGPGVTNPWSVPEASVVKFEGSSLEIDCIDGGVI